MIKKLAVSAASVLTAAVITAFPMCASAFSVEQIQTEMPDINVFYTSDSGEGDVELMLDNVPLKTTEPQSFFDTGMPACYYLLIDDSGSVTAPQMEAVKNALKNNCTFIRDTDTVNIISIGTLDKLFSGSISDEGYTQAVDSFINNKQDTFLYEALDSVNNDIASKNSSYGVRNIIIAVSDGLDDSNGRATYEDVAVKLLNTGVPLYALGISGNYGSDLTSFGELAKRTGGDMTPFTADECETVFDELGERITSCKVIKGRAENNLVGETRTVTVRCLAQNYSSNFSVFPVRWIPDMVPPEMVAFEKISDHQFKVEFSENVRGADTVEAYSLKRHYVEMELVSVVYNSDNGKYTATLTTKDEIDPSDYMISTKGVYDISNENNALSGNLSLRIKGDTQEYIEPESMYKNDKTLTYLVIASIVLLMAAMLAVIGFVLRKKPLDNTEKHDKHADEDKHVNLPPHSMIIRVNDGRTLRVNIRDKIVVGRSQENDIYFNDMNMSRVHFTIEYLEGRCYLTDNNSFTGTYVNGERVGINGLELNKGDEVSAGHTSMIIRWE